MPRLFAPNVSYTEDEQSGFFFRKMIKRIQKIRRTPPDNNV